MKKVSVVGMLFNWCVPEHRGTPVTLTTKAALVCM